MIAEAVKGKSVPHLTFEAADALDPPYAGDSFDAVAGVGCLIS